jgi:hypothetical protein
MRLNLSDVQLKLAEWAVILEASPRTRACLIFAVICPLAFLLAGEYFTGRIDFEPPLDALVGPVREAILHRYGEAAIVTFTGFMGAAGANFRKTRRRLYYGH